MQGELVIKIYVIYFVIVGIILRIRKLKGSNNFWNKTVNLLVYFFEFFTFGILFNYVIDNHYFEMQKDLLSVLKDFVFSNSIYQIVINMILKFWDGASIDAYNSAIVYIKNCMVLSDYRENLKEFLKLSNKDLKKLQRAGTYDTTLLDVFVSIDEMNSLYLSNEIEQKNYKNNLELKLIHLQNSLSILSFGWQSSVLLRLLK